MVEKKKPSYRKQVVFPVTKRKVRGNGAEASLQPWFKLVNPLEIKSKFFKGDR